MREARDSALGTQEDSLENQVFTVTSNWHWFLWYPYSEPQDKPRSHILSELCAYWNSAVQQRPADEGRVCYWVKNTIWICQIVGTFVEL